VSYHLGTLSGRANGRISTAIEEGMVCQCCAVETGGPSRMDHIRLEQDRQGCRMDSLCSRPNYLGNLNQIEEEKNHLYGIPLSRPVVNVANSPWSLAPS